MRLKDHPVLAVTERIRALATRPVTLMEVCGTHTMTISRSGIRRILPPAVRLVSGPGCPVCVTPSGIIDYAVGLGARDEVIVATFGDMVRVPGTRASLETCRPRVIYSPLDALAVARDNPKKAVVLMGIGFETTAPAFAAALRTASREGLQNLYLLPAFKLIPPALEFLARQTDRQIDGFILPGHVSAIIGTEPYRFLAERYGLPGCVAGFEPVDVLLAITHLLEDIQRGHPTISNEYRRVVQPEGNRQAQQLLHEFFEPTPSEWRGIGMLSASGLTLRRVHQRFNCFGKYPRGKQHTKDPPGCRCGDVLLGKITPLDCPLYGRACTPATPVGPCMVSSEGTCAAYFRYGGD